MATQEDKAATQRCLAEVDVLAQKLGHDLKWRPGRDSDRKGCVYHWVGFCWSCYADVTVDPAGSSCASNRDARQVYCEPARRSK
jgi:hypothetical protein